MKKSRILFIIDDDILAVHHGVRRYVLSLSESIKNIFDIDFVIHRKISFCESFYKVVFSHDFVVNNGFFSDYLVGQSKSDIVKKISSNSYKGSQSNIDPSYTTSCIGSRLSTDYSFVIVAAPWIHINKNIFSCPVACIGLDAIPNIYSFHDMDNHPLREFAWRHKVGFEYYDMILSISEDSKNQISSFTSRRERIYSLPPFKPAGFNDVESSDVEPRNKSIILAAPFDERKGLKYMPEIINKTDADELIIFGGVRCSLDNLMGFFESINIEKIEWWYSVTTLKQIELYKKARVLLFPSLNEGLGLPVLEALACDRPAIVSDIKPLNTLVDKEYIINIDDDVSDSADRINQVLNSDYPIHEFDCKWDRENLVKFINDITNRTGI
ncbi:glycosyltransferase family 4 protein [Dickeya oryzae]|uniref:Glycosyltransferase family 4 protein n=1 Tax=Dickeya oryzae TaxID=1240404 RepID=A0AB39IRA8_9GAMM|nr:glycosyltransferase family 4 protein [Dickeya oryzae]MBP2857904.1 glycosyltransferase family 4 protein [Dickeya oryzae]MCA6992200.1 glycosyltransferase family 4 protein [Dickeya oryzae]